MSYFLSFPVEILAHIFMLVTHGDEETSFSPYLVSHPVFNTTSVRTPVIISCVNLSQKVTYLFCDELDIDSKSFISRVRQATKDVVKSEV